MESKEWKKILDYHDNLYYNLNTQEITDEEYDAIKQKYLNLIHQEEYDYVPGEASADSIKYTQELLASDVGVLFLSDNINTILPDSELRLTIMSSIAQ